MLNDARPYSDLVRKLDLLHDATGYLTRLLRHNRAHGYSSLKLPLCKYSKLGTDIVWSTVPIS